MAVRLHSTQLLISIPYTWVWRLGRDSELPGGVKSVPPGGSKSASTVRTGGTEKLSGCSLSEVDEGKSLEPWLPQKKLLMTFNTYLSLKLSAVGTGEGLLELIRVHAPMPPAYLLMSGTQAHSLRIRAGKHPLPGSGAWRL